MILVCISRTPISPAWEAERLQSAFCGTVAHSGGGLSKGATVKKIPIVIGHKYGRLTVLSQNTERTKKQLSWWNCRCDCGAIVISRSYCLKVGIPKSCGCARADSNKSRATHGCSRRSKATPEYCAWQGMKQRCYYPKMENYPFYGGRGIKVCSEWRKSFTAFLADMGKKPHPSYSIERINTNGNYEPGNCVWATKLQQANNTRTNRIVEINGKKNTLANWCREYGIPRATVNSRIWQGATVVEAVTRPIDTRRRGRWPAKSETASAREKLESEKLTPVIQTPNLNL